MKHLLLYLKPNGRRMTLGFVIKTIGTVIELLIPYILSYILKDVILRERTFPIVAWGAVMMLAAASACACNIIANRMSVKVSADFSREMRKDLFSKTMSLSSKEIDRFTIPSLESRITTDTYNVQNFVSMMQRMGVRAPILLIGGIGITLVMDARLALVMIATLPLIFLTVYSISRQGVPLYRKVQLSVDSMTRVVREDVMGIRVIKALSKGEYENRRYDVVNKNLCKDERRAGIIMGSVNPIMTLLMNMGIIGVIALSSVLVHRGVSDVETVIAFMQYFTLISMAMMSVSRIFVMYTKASASAKRISEILLSESELEVMDIEEIDTDNYLEFRNVSFSYLGSSNNVENISFSLKKGQSLGIIGATGSGKSTLIRLLMRFYDVNEGNVYVNGKDVRSYGKKEFSSLFGVVLQNDFLYSESIRENIKFGRDISDQDVVWAAKIAMAHDFISAFEDGYDHVLTPKGTNLSGGQRQRILIARALAGRPEILILDDSSSALDYKTDALLRRALAEETKGMTIITVAQRVSSVKNSDLILVVDEGKILASGTHEQLLEISEEYKEIANSQMGGAFLD